MKTVDSIRKFLIINSIAIYAFLLIIIGCMVLVYKTTTAALEESREYLYAYTTNGEIVPMQWVNRRDAIEIEAKHHLTYFVKNFYDLNLENWEQSINKALYLGDFENIHNNRANTGYYNKFIQYNVVQKAELYPEYIELDMSSEPYAFNILIVLTENYRSEQRVFNVFAKGYISLTDRNFPYNPHGMWIQEYIESDIIKIEK